MKKITALIFALILTLGLVGCNGKTVNIDFPFEVEDVESVEMYHYNGAPASAEKKVVVAESDIKTLYDMFKGCLLYTSRDRGDRARHECFAHRPARAAPDHQERRHFGTECPEGCG